MRSVGFWIAVGAGIALVGFAISNGWFSWFGRLPGDVRIETDKTRVYFPITSMLIVSVAASALLALLRRLF
jgi:membrane protein implicated in regulation of membrane protease activity